MLAEVSVRDAKTGLSDMMNRAAYGGERIVITSRGKAKAALISIEDLRLFEEMELEVESRMLERAIKETSEFHSLEQLMAGLPEEPGEV